MGVDGNLTAHLFVNSFSSTFSFASSSGVRSAGAGIVRAVVHVKAETGDVVLNEFVVVLDALDAEEDGAEDQGGNEEEGDELFLADLGGPDGHGHGEAAADQDDGIDGAPA